MHWREPLVILVIEQARQQTVGRDVDGASPIEVGLTFSGYPAS